MTRLLEEVREQRWYIMRRDKDLSTSIGDNKHERYVQHRPGDLVKMKRGGGGNI